MASLRFLLLCGLLTLPARPQLVGQAYPHFELRADPPSPRTQVVAGYLQAGRSLQAGAIGHRYFYDETAHTYYGYDIVIQAERQGDWYSVMYYDLSIGPLDFSEGPADALHPTIWKKLPLPALPAPHGIRAGEALENLVSVDPSTGQRLIDSMDLMPAPQANSSRSTIGNLQPQIQFRSTSTSSPVRVAYRGPGVLLPGDFTVPFVSGTAREFSSDDAEMTIQQARVTFNEVRQQLASTVHLVSGSLLWFYVPEHGRYVLSLLPRPKLGFTQSGEVRGGAASFTIDADQVRLESPNAIAPGKAPYLLYVLHDPAWVPTAQTQSGSLLVGSVSAGELDALTRK